MSYDEYWFGDVWRAWAYYSADRKRLERMDLAAWLNGLYVCKALEATVGNIGRRPGDTPVEYPDKPVTSIPKLTEQQRIEQEAAFAEAYMNQMVLVGKDWGKEPQQEQA